MGFQQPCDRGRAAAHDGHPPSRPRRRRPIAPCGTVRGKVGHQRGRRRAVRLDPPVEATGSARHRVLHPL
eukprot:4888438-Lingulodinium_polyedra.AAC.1